MSTFKQLYQSYNHNNAPSTVYNALVLNHGESTRSTTRRGFVPPVNASWRAADQDFFEGTPEVQALLQRERETRQQRGEDRQHQWGQEPQQDSPSLPTSPKARPEETAQRSPVSQMLSDLQQSIDDLKKEYACK